MSKEDHLYEAHKDLQGQGLIQPRVLMAMDEYAKELAIGFAEWMGSEGYVIYDGNDRWIAPHNNNNVYSTKELFDLYIIQSKTKEP